MKFREFQDKETDRAYLEFLTTVDWPAAETLHEALVNDTFHEKFGETARAFYVTDGDNIVGFFNLTETDYLDVPEFDRFIAMLYVSTDYRHRHLSQAFITAAEAHLIAEGDTEAHLMTSHHGLYEQYGYELVRELPEGPHEQDYLYTKKLVN